MKHQAFDNYVESWHQGVELVLHYASGRCGWTKVGLYLWHKLDLNPALCGTVALMVTQKQKTIRATVGFPALR